MDSRGISHLPLRHVPLAADAFSGTRPRAASHAMARARGHLIDIVVLLTLVLCIPFVILGVAAPVVLLVQLLLRLVGLF